MRRALTEFDYHVDGSYLPTDEGVAFYQEHGWFVSPRILPDEIIDDVVAGVKEFYSGKRDKELPIKTGYSDWKVGDREVVRNNEFTSLQKLEIDRLIRCPEIGAIAARLARTNQIRLLDDQLVYKPPHGLANTAIGWHADHAYWGTCSSNSLLTAWIPFQDVDEHNGCLAVMDGSHKWDGLEHARFFKERDLAVRQHEFRRQGRRVTLVPMTLKKGQVSFHHCWTLHASFPNHSRRPRIALGLHLQDEQNRYRTFQDRQGNDVHIANEFLCRTLPNGDPDFADPNIFPTLWPKNDRSNGETPPGVTP